MRACIRRVRGDEIVLAAVVSPQTGTARGRRGQRVAGPGGKLYDYPGISYDAAEGGAALDPAEHLGTTTGAATPGGYPDRPDGAPTTTGR